MAVKKKVHTTEAHRRWQIPAKQKLAVTKGTTDHRLKTKKGAEITSDSFLAFSILPSTILLR